MGVTVDEAGKNGRVREVDDIRARWNLEVGSRSHTLDALALNHNDHVFPDTVAGGVEEAADQKVGHFGRRFLGGRAGRILREADAGKNARQRSTAKILLIAIAGIDITITGRSVVSGMLVSGMLVLGMRRKSRGSVHSCQVGKQFFASFASFAVNESGSVGPVKVKAQRCCAPPDRVRNPVPRGQEPGCPAKRYNARPWP